ncbi:unnamed protein product [Calypogeia fissa]
MLLAEKLAEPLRDLPPVEFAFSYGSGVFPQPGDSGRPNLEKPMVDYILGVSCPAEWHSKNIEKNPHHYSSWLANFGGKWVSGVAENVGVGVHFNPFVPWKDKSIKYGVISMDYLERDISTWNSLYISGRLQKPVCVLVDTAGLAKLNETNLEAALLSAMLLAPPEFTEEELYMQICGLSYLGDIRMLFAEDRHKVRKIVRGSLEKFRVLYKSAIHSAASSGLLELPTSSGTHPQSKLVQRVDTASVCRMVSALPSNILQRLASQIGVTFEGRQSGMAVAEAVSQARDGHAKLLRKAIGGVVRCSSIRQVVSGLFAAGGVNAVHYVARKASKAWQSRQ